MLLSVCSCKFLETWIGQATLSETFKIPKRLKNDLENKIRQKCVSLHGLLSNRNDREQ